MAKTAYINTRVEPDLKKDAEIIFSQLGLSMSDAVALFLRQSVMSRGLPFPVRTPNAETVEAIKEPRDNLRRYASSEEMFASILSDND